MSGVEKAVLRAPDGAQFHISFDGDDLWIHAEASDGGRLVYIDRFEANAGNEGWLRLRRRERPAAQPLTPRPRQGALA